MSHRQAQREGLMVRIAIGFTAWAEKWFPDAFIFVAIAVVVVAAAAFDRKQVAENTRKVVQFCKANPNVTVMQAVERLKAPGG